MLATASGRVLAGFVGLVGVVVGTGWVGAIPAGAVAGGAAAADGAHRFAVQLQVGERGCSGALVHPQWVVTASTCFAENGAAPAGAPKVATTATVGRTNLSGTGGYLVGVIDLVPRTDRGVVLAKLARPVRDVPVVAVGATAPTAGEVLRVAGFGRTATEWVPDVLHTAQFTVQETTGTTLALAPVGTAGASTCKGDSGGPTFREVNGVAQLVAVHSTSWQRGCFVETETRSGVTETRLDDLVQWVADTTREVPAEDFDNDRRPDVPGFGNGNLYANLNRSTVGQPAMSGPGKISTTWASVTEQKSGDFDADGKPDIIGRVGKELRVWLSTSTPGAVSHAAAGVSVGAGWDKISKWATTDFDGDGRVDIVAFGTDGQLSVTLGTGTVGKPSVGDRINVSPKWSTVREQTFFDYDGDGLADIVGRVTSQELWVWRNTSTVGRPQTATGFVLGKDWDTVGRWGFADYDSDGKVDILSYDLATGGILSITLNTSTIGQPARGARVKISGPGWASVKNQLFFDYDGDRKPDIIGQVGNELRVWLNDSVPGRMSNKPVGVPQGPGGWNGVSRMLLPGYRV